MKKLLGFLIIFLSLAVFASCGKKEAPPATDGSYTSIFPKAVRAAHIYKVEKPETLGEAFTLSTLQGQLAKKGPEQIYIDNAVADSFLDIIIRDYAPEITEAETWELVEDYAGMLGGYILVNDDGERASVATSLCSPLNAIIVTESNRSLAESKGLTMVLDARDKTDGWLRESQYFASFNKKIAFSNLDTLGIYLRDYAVLIGGYFYDPADFTSSSAHSAALGFLDDNFIVLGWNPVLGEFQAVSDASKLNGSVVAADFAANLSTLSGFGIKNIFQKRETPAGGGENKHTVTFVMTDGDNLQWCLKDYPLSEKWFGSPYRGAFDMGWGVPASMIDLASPALKYFYENMTARDNFILSLSGTGYTFPSKWKNPEALDRMAGELNSIMEREDLKILEILDNAGLDTNPDAYLYFTKQPAIEGILYIDYTNYARYKGEISWIGGKPIVSAKYDLWSGMESVQSLADKLNDGFRDPSSVGGYSFVIIHCWSGLDNSGNIVDGGNTMNGVKAVVDLLEEDIDVVTPEVFMERIIRNNAGRN
jgi:hypothetical protein